VGTVLVALLAGAGPAGAHPLGNFTTNRYARVEVAGSLVRVYYVLDEAELRAFEERDAIAADRPGFVADRVASIGRGLKLAVDGAPLALEPSDSRLDMLPGQGGLQTLRLSAVFAAPLPPGPGPFSATFSDTNEPDRIGWRELLVVARGEAVLRASDAASRDTSDELRRYPADLLRAPIDQRSASFSFEPGAVQVGALPLTPPAQAPSRAGGRLTELVERQGLTPFTLLGMFGVAFVFGSAHALGPGHGKTVMASYLVGTRGRTVDAVLLGVIVALMHTGSVLVLGLALFELDRYSAVERIYPILTVVSGVAVVAFGGVLLIRRVRVMRRKSDPDHDHDHGHAHDEHDHHHGPGGHSHDLPEGTAPLSRAGLVLLATSGGLIPSPSAVLVVVAAFAAGRVALGLSLVLAFSIGLAATLSAVGTGLVLGRRVLERRFGGTAVRVLPVFGAGALVVVGLVLLGTGVAGVR